VGRGSAPVNGELVGHARGQAPGGQSRAQTAAVRASGRITRRLRQEAIMARYFFYSADLYSRDDTQLTGGFHGVMTVDDDAKSASDVFGEITDMLQSQTQGYIQEIARNSGQSTDPNMFYFVVKQFYRVE
jgi:hypothetical protein